jgi:NRPS condensation-like uncharacterized protein
MNQNEGKCGGINLSGCIRRLSNFERYLLWSAENNMAAVARILGDVLEDDLRRAIDSVGSAHPLMRARIVSDGDRDIWFSRDDALKARLRTVPRTSDEQWFDEVRQEYLTPFEPEKGPMIRFVLVHSQAVSEIIAFSQHCICDGISIANLLSEILASYADPSRVVSPICPPVTTDYLNRDGNISSNSYDTAAFDRYNDEWRKRPHYFSQEDFCIIYEALARRFRHEIVLLELEPEETQELVLRCRENGATVTSALTAAFLVAYQEVRGLLPENRRSIQVPFDLRRRLDLSHEGFLGFFVGAFKFPFIYDQRKPFWENAHELQKIIQERAEMLDASAIDMANLDPALVDAFPNCAPYVDMLPEAFSQTENLSAFAKDRENIAFELCLQAVNNFPGTISSNIGGLYFPEVYGSLKLDRIFFVAPASEAFPLFVAGASVNGRLAFSLNYLLQADEGDSVKRDMIQTRNRALEYLGFPGKVNDRAM